jgi:hypothetical protein
MSAYRMLCFGASLGSIIPLLQAQPPSAITFFSPRSQAANSAEELIRDQQYIYQNRVSQEHMFDLSVAYAHSLSPNRLASIVFGADVFTVSGSAIPERGVNDLLADYFGLSPAFISTVQMRPEIRSSIVAGTLYYNLEKFISGAYIDIQIPFVWTATNVGVLEELVSTGTDVQFPADYMSIPAISTPSTSFAQALRHSVPFGSMQEPRLFGNLNCEKLHKATIANITADFGWNYFFNEEQTSHFGLKVRVVTPNGTRPKNRYLYEPIAGNGHHTEFGIGLNGHAALWIPDDGQELSLYGNLLITHLFKSRQCRSFDLHNIRCNSKFFSRYMLVKEFDSDGLPTGKIAPLINYSTLPCDISTAAQFDGSLMFAYNRKHLTFNLGYNGWIRTKESIHLCGGLPYNRLGLKGIQNTFTPPTNAPSDATESSATIFGTTFNNQSAVTDPLSPQFINTQDLDPHSARSPLVLTHKIFTYLGYTCGKLHKSHSFQPFFGIGGELEFEGINDINEFEPPTDKNTMAQWSIWFKLGLMFG